MRKVKNFQVESLKQAWRKQAKDRKWDDDIRKYGERQLVRAVCAGIAREAKKNKRKNRPLPLLDAEDKEITTERI